MAALNAGFSEEECKQLEKALTAARDGTCAEIVPVVVKSCSRYERAADILGLFVAVLFSLLLLFLYPDARPPLYLVIVCQLIGFLIGALLLGRIDGLRFILSGRAAMSQRVRESAAKFFAGLGVGPDGNSSRVMIYCALFERQVVILADPALSSDAKPEVWTGIRDQVLEGLREGNAVEGWCQAIATCGKVLAEVRPKNAEVA